MSITSFLKKPRGFTIVELLIVIVIIGILASITIVSYAGVTQRTENNKTIAAVQAVMSVMTKIKAETGRFPLSDEIGGDYTCVGIYVDAKCASISGVYAPSAAMGIAYSLAQFETLVKKYNGNVLPQPSIQTPTIDGFVVTGVFIGVQQTIGASYSITWVLSGTGDCGIKAATKRFQDDGGRVCYFNGVVQ